MPNAEIKLAKSEAVSDLLETRHILDDDLKQVIEHAESTGEKLYLPGAERFLSKYRVGPECFYVEYSPSEGGYRIHTAYTHRSLIVGE
jgi:glutamate synthase (NADPH/NADH) small chain